MMMKTMMMSLVACAAIALSSGTAEAQYRYQRPNVVVVPQRPPVVIVRPQYNYNQFNNFYRPNYGFQPYVNPYFNPYLVPNYGYGYGFWGFRYGW